MWTTEDEKWMSLALKLAERGRGQTAPNPLVGAVIVKDGLLVAEGFHAKAGGDHAEAVALKKAGEQARDADLYVTLEPCCHYGRTPPCTAAIKQAGIRRVVAAVADPNPKVAGGGMRELTEAGVQVQVGLFAKQAWQQNAAFMTRVLQGRPLVVWKAAASLDGRIALASGESQWITGQAARDHGRSLRQELDAVLVGSGTVLVDDPLLTVRPLPPGHQQPLRIVLDRRARVNPQSRIFQDHSGPVWWGTEVVPIFTEPWYEHCQHLQAEPGELQPEWLLQRLQEHGVTSVLLEGGGHLAAAFWRAGLIDQVRWYLSPKLVGAEGIPALGQLGLTRLAASPELQDVELQLLGKDILLTAWAPNRPWLTEKKYWEGNAYVYGHSRNDR